MSKRVFVFLVVLVGLICFLYYFNRKVHVVPLIDFFSGFSLFESEGKDYFISDVTRISFSPEKIFLLDNRQKTVFVFSETMSYLNKIGRPGQGPGDLENPVDLCVRGDEVFVLESTSRRLNIFKTNGDFIKSIYLKLPEEIFYSYPSALLVDNDNNYLVAYSLSAHLLDVFDADGNFKETLLRRDDPVIIYRKNIGNTSSIGFLPSGAVLHFNELEGTFTELFLSNIVGRQFRVQDDLLFRRAQDLKKAIAKESKSGPMQSDIMSFLLFTNFCVDSKGWVYVCKMRRENHEKQKMWIFKEHGDSHLSDVVLPNDEIVRMIYYWGGKFFFVTDEGRIWISKRRAQ